MDRESLQRNLASFLGVHYPAWSQVVEAVRALAWLALPTEPAPPAELGAWACERIREQQAWLNMGLEIAASVLEQRAGSSSVMAEVAVLRAAAAAVRAKKLDTDHFTDVDKMPKPAPATDEAPDCRRVMRGERPHERAMRAVGDAVREAEDAALGRAVHAAETWDAAGEDAGFPGHAIAGKIRSLMHHRSPDPG